MSYKTKKFIINRDIPKIILIIFLISIIVLPIFVDLNEYSNLILVGITAVYAYFTYELLRTTKSNNSLAYIKLEFVCVSDLKSVNFKKLESDIEHSEEYIQIKQDFEDGTLDRNIVFIMAQNMGMGLAIGTKVEIKYDQKTVLDGFHENLTKTLNFGDLKEGGRVGKLFCMFEHASTNDLLNIKKVRSSFQDISGHNNNEGEREYDMTNNIGYIREENVSFIFKK